MSKRPVLISVAVVAVSWLLVLLVIRSSQSGLYETVIRKGWTKTFESWSAGGSEYYVLDVEYAQIQQRAAMKRVALRSTGAVPLSTFEKFNGEKVAVRGRFVKGVPFVRLVGSEEQYPTSGDPPEPILRGGGFEVYAIDPLD